jgi:hypothetical protein
MSRGHGADRKAFLQPGAKQVCAGYAVYGPTTLLVLTLGDGVNVFTLDREYGRFVLTQNNVRIPEDTREFAINASNARYWEAPVKRYVDELLAGKDGPRGQDFNMRWVASMVADVHRILSRGGIFMYPIDSKTRAQGGKLRLMYEANPMAFIVEQAGGAATDGRQRILDIQPEKLHQRVPVILGSKNEVERVTAYHARPARPAGLSPAGRSRRTSPARAAFRRRQQPGRAQLQHAPVLLAQRFPVPPPGPAHDRNRGRIPPCRGAPSGRHCALQRLDDGVGKFLGAEGGVGGAAQVAPPKRATM